MGRNQAAKGCRSFDLHFDVGSPLNLKHEGSTAAILGCGPSIEKCSCAAQLSPRNAVLEENFLKLIFVKICLIALVAKLFTSPFFEFYQVPF
jgi:hypothetical protein